MSEVFQGFVAKLSTKTGTGKRGAWTAYSAKIEKDDGSEYDQWVSFGFEDPGIQEGDYIRVTVAEENGRMKAQGKPQKSKNPPARKGKSNGRGSSGGSGGYAGGRSGGGGNRFDGTGIQNKSNPEDVARITTASAFTTAIAYMSFLASQDALPVSKAKTKAGEANRMAELDAMLTKYAGGFQAAVLAGKVPDTLFAADKAADGPIPDAEEGGEDQGEAEDGFGPPDEDEQGDWS